MNAMRAFAGARLAAVVARPIRLGKLRLLAAAVVLGAAGLAVGVQGPSASPKHTAAATIPPQVALDWNLIAVNTVRAAAPAKFQIEGTIYMAYVQAAVYDAVTAINHRYVPYHAFGVSAAGASPRAAVAAAAYTTLSYYFPAQAPALAAAYTDYLAGPLALVRRAAKAAGVAVGAAAAADLIATRWGDGRDAAVATAFGVAPQAPGGWVFAPAPSLQSAQTPWAASMRPFMLTSASQFRAPAPPALSSPGYAQQLNEVKMLGSATSTVRTSQQTAIAQFWNANAINQYNQIVRDLATKHTLDLVDTVHLLAMADMVGADAGISCMDSKYKWLRWRPITAIRAADQDGNDATSPDPTWTPLLVTPNHPEYPSAHGCVTAAVTEVIQSVFKGDTSGFDVPGATGGATTLTTSRHFNSVDDLQKEVIEARIWGGLHLRGSDTAGVDIGRQVAQWTLKRFFQPVK
jgi:hypothetical protein